MKIKIFLLLLVLTICVTGCFGGSKKDIVNNFEKKYDNLKSYKLTGELQITNNDDVYNYDVKVTFQRNDKFNVNLVNKANEHEQIILKNEEGVYVLTPSLNKSFKFQSDWPYNNSQIYLIQSILSDVKNDKKRVVVEEESGYMITSVVNYPNNRRLVKQVIKLDKNHNLKEIRVVDEKDIVQMKMTIKTLELNVTIDKNEFNLNKIMESKSVPEKTEETSFLEDTIYPLYIPLGTVLTSEEKIAKTNGERIIMTFDGEKPFLLVQETANIESVFSIVPTYGEPYLLVDTVGALSNSSISWSSNGIDYYLVSDVMSQEELIKIARSVSVIPTMK